MSTLVYVIKDGLYNMDFQRVTEMLSQAYWSPGIKLKEVLQGARHSTLVTGAFLNDGTQVGYARVVSDKTRFAYIMDVFVDEKYRGKGIGRDLVRHLLNHVELKDVYHWLLATKDAHSVYRTVGFESLKQPEIWMEIRHPRPQR